MSLWMPAYILHRDVSEHNFQLVLVWHAERCWAVPHRSSSLIPFKDYLIYTWGSSILSLLRSSWKEINPPERQRVSLILDRLNQLLVSTGATATVFLPEMLQMQMKTRMNCVKLHPVPALVSPCCIPVGISDFKVSVFKLMGWKGKQSGPMHIEGEIFGYFAVRRPEVQAVSSCKGHTLYTSLVFHLPVCLLLQLSSENTSLRANLIIHMFILNFLGSTDLSYSSRVTLSPAST